MRAASIPAQLVALDRQAIEALAQAHLDAAHGLMGLLDRHDGDSEAEDNGDDEPAGDEQDSAWIEWQTMRGNQKSGAANRKTDTPATSTM